MTAPQDAKLGEAARLSVISGNDVRWPASAIPHKVRQFQRFKSTLLSGDSWRLDMEPAQLAFQALDELRWLLRHGETDPETLKLVADLVGELLDSSGESAAQWNASARIAFRMLGFRKNGRPDKRHAESRALAEFEIQQQAGADVQACEQAAYDTYFGMLNRRPNAFAEDCKREVTMTAEDGRKIDSNVAERFLEKQLRPILRKERLLASKRPGRKPA